jgi:hypothetical protein
VNLHIQLRLDGSRLTVVVLDTKVQAARSLALSQLSDRWKKLHRQILLLTGAYLLYDVENTECADSTALLTATDCCANFK